MAEPNMKREDWPFGVIKEVYPSPVDGKVRSALVKTKMGEYPRPAQRHYLLECGQDGSCGMREHKNSAKTTRRGVNKQ